MKGDFSRLRFSPNKNYTSVLEQQGRVSLDADANEQCAINDYLRTTETVDVVGAVGGPVHDEGFEISVVGDTIRIGKGRYYVEGILCENAEPVFYADQPYLINPSLDGPELIGGLRDGSIIAGKRLRKALHVVEHATAPFERVGSLRLQRQRLIKARQRLRQMPECLEDVATIVERLGVIG